MYNPFHLFSRLYFISCIKKDILSWICFFFCFINYTSSYAQASASDSTIGHPFTQNMATLRGGAPAGSLVLMADGTEKKIEDLQPGESVAAYDPVLEEYTVSKVKDLHVFHVQVPTATVMLILEELSASIHTKGGLAGVNLIVSPQSEVLTKQGPKQVWQLTEDDLLYCYDEAAHRFFTFRVYDLQIKESSAPQTFYYLQTEENNYIINSTVVLQSRE